MLGGVWLYFDFVFIFIEFWVFGAEHDDLDAFILVGPTSWLGF